MRGHTVTAAATLALASDQTLRLRSVTFPKGTLEPLGASSPTEAGGGGRRGGKVVEEEEREAGGVDWDSQCGLRDTEGARLVCMLSINSCHLPPSPHFTRGDNEGLPNAH